MPATMDRQQQAQMTPIDNGGQPIEMGQRYRDTISGYEGIATSAHLFLHGTPRVGLTAPVNQENSIKEYLFEAGALSPSGKGGSGQQFSGQR